MSRHGVLECFGMSIIHTGVHSGDYFSIVAKHHGAFVGSGYEEVHGVHSAGVDGAE